MVMAHSCFGFFLKENFVKVKFASYLEPKAGYSEAIVDPFNATALPYVLNH
jgi:hypothetical protein